MDKPLLLLSCPGNASNKPGDANTGRIKKVLDTLGVWYHDRYIDDSALIDPSDYCGCLLLWTDAGITAHQAWLDGTKGIPVFAVGAWRNALKKVGTCDTGSTADGINNAVAPSNSYHKITDGTHVSYASGGAHVSLNENGVPVWTNENGDVICWKNANHPTWYTLYTPSQYSGIWIALNVLSLFNIAPPEHPYAIRIDMDDVWGMGEQSTSGLEDFIDWLRERGAVALFGVDGYGDRITHSATNFGESAEVRALLQANPDVCKIVLHSHSHQHFYLDNAPYDTIAAKIASVEEGVANLRALGYTVEDNGAYLGHFYTYGNAMTAMSLRAMAEMGIKVVRVAADTAGIGSCNNILIHDDTDGVRHIIHTVAGQGGLAGATTKSKAEIIAAQSPATENRLFMNSCEGRTMRGILCGAADSQSSPTVMPLFMEHLREYADVSHLPEWEAAHAYNIGDYILPTNFPTSAYNGYYYRCTRAGTSEAAEPTWPTNWTAGDSTNWTVDDGACQWTLDPWAQGCDNVGMYLLNVYDGIVKLSNGWIRWAGTGDLYRMTGGRRG